MSFGVGVGDIIIVCRMAFQLVSSIRAAPEELESLATELQTLKHCVKAISDRVASTHLPDTIARSTGQQLSQCHNYLQTLEETTTRYTKRCMDKGGSRPFTRLRWGVYKREKCLELMRELRRLADILDCLLRHYTPYATSFNTQCSKIRAHVSFAVRRSRNISRY